MKRQLTSASIHCLYAIFVFTFVNASLSAAATTAISINSKTTYQTIEGLGGFGGKTVWWSGDDPNTYFDANWISLLVDTIGISVLRDAVPPCFDDPYNANADSIDIHSHPYGDHKFDTHIPYWNALKDAGMTKFTFSQWSPPDWMKSNGSFIGGTIKDGMYDKFGNRCASFCKLFKKYTGLDAYGMGIQNEPSNDYSFESCQMSNDQQRLCMIAMGKEFEQDGITTKIHWPDDCTFGYYADDIKAVVNDTNAKKYPWALSSHYAMGTPGGWPSLDSMALAHNLKYWGTEQWCDGGHGGWPDASWAGMEIDDLLSNGASLFTFWLLGGINQKQGECLIYNTTPDKRVYVVRQYMRFIRPGAVRMKTTCSDTSYRIEAYYLQSQDIWTVVVMTNVNDAGGGTKNISITCDDPSFPQQLELYVTSSSDNCVNKGKVPANNFQVPASSVSTLVSRMPDLPPKTVSLQRPNLFIGQVLRRNGRTLVYDLRGRCIPSPAAARSSGIGQKIPHGIYLKVFLRENGTVLATEKELSLPGGEK